MFTIAEIGTAWQGDFGDLYNLVKHCKEAGFSAVKLQAFKKEHLNSRYFRTISAVNEFNVEKIKEVMQEVGIPWGCSVIYPEAVEFLKGNVDFWKIRYKDNQNDSIVNAVVDAMEGEEVAYISIDKDTDDEILGSSFNKLYCIPKYPHMVHEIDWEQIQKYQGWSCHCPSMAAVESAKALGCQQFEFHIVPNSATQVSEYVDLPVAFPVVRFKQLFEILNKE